MGRPRQPRCVIDGCEAIATNKKAQLCHRCYNRLAYQLKKGVTWMVKRARQIDSWQGGLQYLLGTEKITRIKTPRRRRAA